MIGFYLRALNGCISNISAPQYMNQRSCIDRSQNSCHCGSSSFLAYEPIGSSSAALDVDNLPPATMQSIY
jgi:hypothetical protein